MGIWIGTYLQRNAPHRALICAIMLPMEPLYSDHTRLDERSVALHQLVAAKVQAAPALLDKARANVRRWQEASGNASPALAEWAQILAAPPVRLSPCWWNVPTGQPVFANPARSRAS